MIVPEGYKQLQALPEDPEGCITYGKQTEQALCMVSLFQINPAEAMDFNGKEDLIHGIHRTVAENQALIEVDSGKLISGKPFIYSVIKTQREEGMQYFLLMHIKWYDSVIAVSGFFDEYGVSGVRDSTVYALYRRENPDFSQDDWFQDPYDNTLPSGFKMNLSEQAKFDEYFPQHPLSQCRQFIEFIKKNY